MFSILYILMYIYSNVYIIYMSHSESNSNSNSNSDSDRQIVYFSEVFDDDEKELQEAEEMDAVGENKDYLQQLYATNALRQHISKITDYLEIPKYLNIRVVGNGGLQNLGKFTNLTHIRLGNNTLTGPIPEDLGNLSELKVLDLHDNKLGEDQFDSPMEGIPSQLGMLTNLRVLNLSLNKLIGIIPTELGNLTNLELMNMSYNYLGKDKFHD